MSILLFSVGAVAFVAGAVMIAFGIPINEFSFGNTLIISGTTAVVGGLIVAGLGAAVSQLQRVADALTTRAPIRSSRPFDTFDPAAAARPSAAPARVPFPPKMKAEPKAELKSELKPDTSLREPHPSETHQDAPPAAAMPFHDRAYEASAPTLPNPDEPPVTVEDEVSLSPRHPMAPAAPEASGYEPPMRHAPLPSSLRADDSDLPAPRDEPPAGIAGRRSQPAAAPAPARPQQKTYFDAMWPAEPRSAEPKSDEHKPAKSPVAGEQAPAPMFNWPRREAAAEPFKSVEPAEFAQAPDVEPHAVAILKSGVVDGMGYTLYVDGSIEAELPQGTLRFASINELRSHLEKTS